MRLLMVTAGVVAAVVVAGTPTAVAQERQMGLKAGLNVSATEFEGATDGTYNERKIGWLGGGFLVFPFQGPVALQLEALFSQKGSKLSLDEEDVEASLELDYLDFPVLLRVDGPAAGAARLHLFAGPSIAYRMGARSKVSYTAFDFAEGSVDNIEDDIERFDLGVVVGAGADIGRRMVVDARYSWGLTNVNKDSSEGIQIKNRVLSIMAGVRF